MEYADDLTILHFLRNPSDDYTQSERENVTRWSEVNSLPINRSKCSVMDIVTKRNLLLQCITDSEGRILDSVNKVTLLSIFFRQHEVEPAF